MDATAAERQRRYRAHKRGDHSLCDPTRCERPLPSEPVTPVTSHGVTPGVRLRARGARLWADLTAAGQPGPAERVLIEEICRLADRLDRFDGIVNGRDKAWLVLELDELGDAQVVVDKVLSEARQQQVAFRALLGELRQAQGKAPAAAGGQQQGGDFRDQLAARRAQRLADAASS